jgi:hypothetical protein
MGVGRSLTRRRFLRGASLGSPGLLAGCGRLTVQAEPRATLPRVGVTGQAQCVTGMSGGGWIPGTTG